MALRPARAADCDLLRQIYADAIESQAPLLYSPEQVQAWAALAWLQILWVRSQLRPGAASCAADFAAAQPAAL